MKSSISKFVTALLVVFHIFNLAGQSNKEIWNLIEAKKRPEAQKALALQSEIVSESARLGIVDADAAYKLLDKTAIEYDEAGKPRNVEALLRELLKSKPYLAGVGGSSVMNPEKTQMFTREQIEKMSTAEINKNWDAIKSYLERSGK